MDGPSARYADALAQTFRNAWFTPKGLLATEGVVSIPWQTSGLCVLAVDSHVLEFVAADDSIHLVDELVVGARYRPLISTGGGLYRYLLGDVVEVVDRLGNTPCVRFVGRSDARSDLAGEKLDDDLVRNALAGLTKAPGAAAPGAAYLVPDADASPPRYRLVVELGEVHAEADLAAAVEARLRRVFHYEQARRIGQLGPVELAPVGNAGAFLQHAWETAGRRAGDAKPAALVCSTELARALCARLGDAR